MEFDPTPLLTANYIISNIKSNENPLNLIDVILTSKASESAVKLVQDTHFDTRT